MAYLQRPLIPWYWEPMGREGSVLRELTKTKEMALAWLFRGLLASVVVLGTGLIGLSTYFVYDLRDRSEKAWIAGGERMNRIEGKQNEIVGSMGIMKQIIVDKGELRDREIRDIDHRLDVLESKVK